MKQYSFYHKETGVIHPKHFTTTDPTQLKGNTPTDHIAIEGSHDELSKRFDLTSKTIVEYQPPAPSADHVWNPEAKRWQLSSAAADRIARSNAARVRIAQLEASQHRHVREHCLGKPDATGALQKIDDEIFSLRSQILKE